MESNQRGIIINKVAQSGIITIDLEDFRPRGERAIIDIKDQLYQGLILKEKDFREYVKQTEWQLYKDKYVAIYCSTDAIIPAWAFMLLAIELAPYAKDVILGNAQELEIYLFRKQIQSVNFDEYKDKRVVVKGCGNIPPAIYVEIAKCLQPYAKSIMYGEPCSTVPLFKRK
ncbi:MAG: DUF2480 family protein [Bacteroidia bacterium]|nr:DUF2480 family protein [Bacteroidia bacterium]MDW8159111.1 DUF2480 family protein [Bacteroidia bacterium]